MHPTKWPSLASVWGSRRALGGLHDPKDPLITLQTLKALKSLKSLQSLQSLQSLHSLRELQAMQRPPLNWPHVASHDFIFYAAKGEEPIFRLDKPLGRAAGAATFPPHWLRPPLTAPPHFEVGGGREVPASRGGGGEWGEWGGLASGWVAGALLLLAALLLVRFVDRIARRMLNLRRRPSEEWPTPTVLATSQQYLEGEEPSRSQSEDSADLPPPYSACARAPVSQHAAGDSKRAREEPPPPYSACYVAYSNPKEGIPSVHFYDGQGQSFGVEHRGAISAPERQIMYKSDGCVTVSAVTTTRGGRKETIVVDSLPSTSGAAGEGTHIVDIG